MKKAEKIKDPRMFWLWITTLFTISLILSGKEDISFYSHSMVVQPPLKRMRPPILSPGMHMI